MTLVILDTNIVFELMKPQPDAAVRHWLDRQEGNTLVTTIVTLSEITFGIALLPEGSRKERLKSAFRTFVGPDGIIPVLELNEDAANRSGQIRASRQSQGQPITLADALIAGIASATQSALATRNVRDFDNLGLAVVNPWTVA